MKDGEIIIKLHNVWKIYQMGEVTVEALRGLDLEIKKGEFVSVMGPSGSGKSTCVNMIGCLDIPTKGSIYLEHKDISHMTESELAQIRGKLIGFVFQAFNLIPTLTALENVMLPMMFQEEKSPEERRVKAKELLTKVGLGDRINHKPSEMSGGQQQRVAIARSLANDPHVIIADEPTGNLDTKTSKDVVEFLTKLHREEKKTIVLVTHDPNIAKFADRTETLCDGRVLKKKKCRGGKE